jgi:hypothetical protein
METTDQSPSVRFYLPDLLQQQNEVARLLVI